MLKKLKNEVIRIAKAFGYSFQGVRSAFESEPAFRTEVYTAVVLIPTAFFLAQTTVELILLLTSPFLVMLAEMLNSAIEAVVDRIGTEHHILSGKAKDVSSSAVLFALTIMGITWGLLILKFFGIVLV